MEKKLDSTKSLYYKFIQMSQKLTTQITEASRIALCPTQSFRTYFENWRGLVSIPATRNNNENCVNEGANPNDTEYQTKGISLKTIKVKIFRIFDTVISTCGNE